MKLIRLLFYLVLFTLPLGQFSKVPLPAGPDVNIYLNDILLPTLVILWLAYKLGAQMSLRLPPFWGWLVGFFAISFVSLVNGLRWVNLQQWLVGGLYLVRWVQYALLYWVGYDLVKNGVLEKKRVIAILIGATGIFAVLGLLQFVLFPDFSKYVQHGWDPHYYRVLSTFFDPNFAGIFLVMGFLLVVAVVLGSWSDGGGVEDRGKQRLYWAVGLLTLVATLLTFSRSTYLALVVGVGIIGFLRSRKLLFIFLALGVLSILFVPRVRTRVAGIIRPDITARLRIQDWQNTFIIIKDHPLTGVGFNTFRYAKERAGFFRDERGVPQPSGHAGAGADSSFLFLWSTAGIFGLFVYLGMLGTIWLKNYQRLEKRADVRGNVIPLVLIALIPAWAVHAQFVNSLFFPWVLEFFWIILALA